MKKHDFGMDFWCQNGRPWYARTNISHYNYYLQSMSFLAILKCEENWCQKMSPKRSKSITLGASSRFFEILERFIKIKFFDDLWLAKSWSPKSNKSERKLRRDDRHQTPPAEPRPSRGEGGSGGWGGSENWKKDRFGESEKRGSARRKIRRIRRTEGDLHAYPMGRQILNCALDSPWFFRHGVQKLYSFSTIYIFKQPLWK